MKKTIVTLLVSFIFIFSYSQKIKPSFGIEGGMGWGGMSALLKTNNAIIRDNSALKKDFSYSGGAFLQVMRKNIGLEIKADYTAFALNAESFSTPENISLRYLSVPVLFKVCVFSNEGYSSGYMTDETYSLIGNTLYHSPSQRTGAGAFKSATFLYGGVQYDMLKKATHTYGTTTSITDDISALLVGTGYSLVGGVEFAFNSMSFDLSYQRSMKTIDLLGDNRINGFMAKFKLRIF